MNDLIINYEQTFGLGKQIINKGDELNEIILKIQSVLAELQVSWQGEEANKILNNLEEETIEMKNLSFSINEIGMLIQTVAASYQSITFSDINL